MSERDKIDMILYNIFESNCSDNENIKYRIEQLANKFNINTNCLYKRYKWLKDMDINPNICHLDENHSLIYKIFDEYNRMLNENNIEYYYTSGILSYLLVNKDLERYHHDLDIFINMNDLDKLEKLCSNYNFSFERKIGKRTENTKRVMLKMYYNDIPDIPITVFMYVKDNDLSITQKDYFIDENDNMLVEYMYNSPQIAKLSFSDIPHYHNNIKYYGITLEALFLCKNENRPKDIYDCSIFKSELNNEKLKALIKAFKNNNPNTIINAEDDPFYEYIFNIIQKRKVYRKHD